MNKKFILALCISNSIFYSYGSEAERPKRTLSPEVFAQVKKLEDGCQGVLSFIDPAEKARQTQKALRLATLKKQKDAQLAALLVKSPEYQDAVTPKFPQKKKKKRISLKSDVSAFSLTNE